MNDRSQPVHLQHAYSLFSSCVTADPTWGEAWYNLGNVNSDLNMIPAAITAWRRGLACDLDTPLRAKMLCNLGWRTHHIGNQQDALAYLIKAGYLDNTLCNVPLNKSMVYGVLGDSEETVRQARLAYDMTLKTIRTDLEPDDPQIVRGEANPVYEMGLAFALLFNGNYREGFEHFEIRFKYKLHQYLHYPYPKWRGEPDKTVYLVADQGLGDTLSFARFVPLAAKRAKFMHMIVQSELMRTFTDAFAAIPNINLIPMAAPFVPADAWSTFVSLPYALGLTDEEIRTTPQIEMPRYTMRTDWMVPDAKFHIGIAYAGSPLNEIDKHRNIPVAHFLDLYRVPEVQLYSLQVGERAKDIHDQGCVGLIRDLNPYIRDVADTVSILRDLDLVICCESALGHICAAANREAWIPYSYLGKDYRLGHRGDKLLWTPKHKIFRQGSDQDWKSVFSAIAEALEERVHGRSGKAAA